jgi:glycine/D-amino acid oxidase-like deaminating enzyme
MAETRNADVCVYGATPAGIVAALAVKRAGHSVLIIEPSRWGGGMLGAGLKPMQDCPNYQATGGLTRQLLKTLGAPEWAGEKLIRSSVSKSSPQAIREDFLKLLREHQIPVIYDHRIAACEKGGAAILKAVFDFAPFDESGCPVADPTQNAHLRVQAKFFIDASYEGDLMARAGVGFRVGRESVDEFNEEHAGIQPPV